MKGEPSGENFPRWPYYTMSDKCRHWEILVYPDSAPDDWISILEQTHLPCYISPLHEYDKNKDGTEKKPHWHVIVSFENTTTYNHVNKSIAKPLNSPFPLALLTLKGAYDYLTHKHNPDKHQYDEEYIIYLNSASKELVDLETVMADAWNMIIADIHKQNIKDFYQLVMYTRQYNSPLINGIIRNNVAFWKEFLRTK